LAAEDNVLHGSENGGSSFVEPLSNFQTDADENAKKATSTKNCWSRKPLQPFSKPLRFKSGQRGIGPTQPVAHKTKGLDPLFQWIQPLYRKQLALGQAAD
jgi:hypothetical protein